MARGVHSDDHNIKPRYQRVACLARELLISRHSVGDV